MTATSLAPVIEMPTVPAPAPLQATVARDELLEALNWASYAVPSRRPPMAVLVGVRLDAAAGGLTVAGYDYTLSAAQTIAAPGAVGSALAPARTLTTLLRTLPRAADVQLRAEPEPDGPGRLTVVSGSPGGLVTFSIPLLPLADYPTLPTVVGPSQVLSGPDLAHLARATVAAGDDDTLPVLTGVLVKAGPAGSVVAVCTDRYRLALAELPATAGTWKLGELLVPHRHLRRTAGAFRKCSHVDLTTSLPPTDAAGGWLQLAAEGRTLTTRLLSGAFPKYESLIPTEATSTLAVDRDVLATSVLQAGAVAVRNSPVRLAVTDQLTVHGGPSQHSPDSTAATVEVPGATLAGPPLDIAFNPGYLRAGLLALPAGQVTFAFTAPTRPMVLRSVDEPSGFLYLLMPVRMYG